MESYPIYLVTPTSKGLYCAAGDFYIDPWRPVDRAVITHAHGDHVGGIAAFEAAGIRVISETEALETSTFELGSVTLRAVDLSGHKIPTAGYFIEGFGKRLLVAGDSIFAGSIGRCSSTAAYLMALDNLRRVLRGAGPECVILPGLGPATIVAEEFSSNKSSLQQHQQRIPA